MIVSFGDRDTERLSRGIRVKRFSSCERSALRKLRQLQVAGDLQDLRIPPGNHLEKLSGDLEGFWSIRVNDQFRIRFEWTPVGPAGVSIVDYH